MKITVARDTLAPALARAAALVPSRITIPIIGCARIETGPGGLSLGTTDCDSWYSETVELEPTEPWSGCVDAARLRGFVHSLPPGSPVELLAPDDRALTIAGTGAKARLAVQRADDFPMFVQPQEGATFDLDAAAFSAALRFVTPSANKDDVRHHLCGAYIDPAGLLVATDGHRMAVHRFAAALPAFDGVILPLPALRLLAAALKGFVDSVSVAVTPRLITFTAGSSSLTSKLIDGTFPEWRRVLPARSRTPIMVETAALRAAVDRITAVCRTALATKASAARLRLSAGELQVSAVTGTPDIEVESTIAVECGSGDVEIGLSARYLAETLAVLDAEQAELHVVASHVNCRVCGAGETENGVLISPMRV